MLLGYKTGFVRPGHIWCSPCVPRLYSSLFLTRRPGNFICSFLLLCGDIQVNPGPVQYPCGVCKKCVKQNESTGVAL